MNLLLCVLCLVCLLPAGSLKAQTIQAGGQNYMSVGDTSVLVNGASYSNVFRVQFNGGGSPLPKWKLTVQPLTAYYVAQQSSSGDIGQFGYGPNWPIQYFSIRLNIGASQNSWSNPNSITNIGAVSTTIPLSASEITLVESSNTPVVASDYFAMAYDVVLAGNRQQMALHRDNYILGLRYRLYNQSGALVSQADYNHQVGLWPGWMHLPQPVGPQISNGILLQNGGANVTLNFGANAGNYASGVESQLGNSLQVSSSDGKYQITVQTLSAYFQKSGVASSLPVSKVRITASPFTSAVVSSYQPVNLSTTARTLITNNGTAGVVNSYNLTYSTKHNSNQDAFMNLPAGNYETQITFIMSPL